MDARAKLGAQNSVLNAKAGEFVPTDGIYSTVVGGISTDSTVVGGISTDSAVVDGISTGGAVSDDNESPFHSPSRHDRTAQIEITLQIFEKLPPEVVTIESLREYMQLVIMYRRLSDEDHELMFEALAEAQEDKVATREALREEMEPYIEARIREGIEEERRRKEASRQRLLSEKRAGDKKRRALMLESERTKLLMAEYEKLLAGTRDEMASLREHNESLKCRLTSMGQTLAQIRRQNNNCK